MRVTEDADDAVSVTGAGGGGGSVGGAVVLVAVKMDSQSKELLTWALVKVAEPGDSVVALHVLNAKSESDKSSLLSMVKQFDSMLAVYEGFCNLKQVDLKLKVCRGSSVKKSIVEEANSYAGAKVIVGSSKGNRTLRSSFSVAKYCARKLSKKFSVYAVDNGKVLFKREASLAKLDNSQDDKGQRCDVSGLHKQLEENAKEGCRAIDCFPGDRINTDCHHCLRRSCSGCRRELQRKMYKVYSSSSVSSDSSEFQEELLDGEVGMDNALALVPYQAPEAEPCSSAVTVQTSPEPKHRWGLLRDVFMPKLRWILRLPSHNSSSVVYPDQKQNQSEQDEEHCSEIDENNGAIVPFGEDASSPRQSDNDRFSSISKELEGLHEKYSITCRLLNYQDILVATSNFASENLIGKGGSSRVYRGCLSDGKELAMKVLKPSEEVVKEFVSEIEIITTLHHKNIISLFGFCYEDNNLVLVYDYLSRGSLEEILHGNKKDIDSFSWHERYKVALGVAEALDYLHNSCTEPVIHRDVKSSNILLFDDFEPQLSDFGLANRPSTSSPSFTCTDVAGTFGYLAPEYFMHGKVSDKIDVYAFGVVLLELLSGRKPIDGKQPQGQESIVLWAKPKLEDEKVPELLDPRLGDDYDHDQIKRMALAASLCIRRSPHLRPHMNLVVKLLQGDEEAVKWTQQQVGTVDEDDDIDGEVVPSTSIQSHLNVALQDIDDDSLSPSSIDQTVSVDDYLHGRWSRASSFG